MTVVQDTGAVHAYAELLGKGPGKSTEGDTGDVANKVLKKSLSISTLKTGGVPGKTGKAGIGVTVISVGGTIVPVVKGGPICVSNTENV